MTEETKVSCPKCKESTPSGGDIAVCIREFGECVDCKIANDDFYEDDLIWIKAIQDKSKGVMH